MSYLSLGDPLSGLKTKRLIQLSEEIAKTPIRCEQCMTQINTEYSACC